MSTNRRPIDSIRVAKNCPASWNKMCGTDRVRHCTHCNRRVYNLSNMTREEAEGVVANAEGRLCVRFYRRKDGRMMTRDCGRAVRAGIALKMAVVGVMAAIGIPLALGTRSDDGQTSGMYTGMAPGPAPQPMPHPTSAKADSGAS